MRSKSTSGEQKRDRSSRVSADCLNENILSARRQGEDPHPQGLSHVQYGYVRALTAEVIGRDRIGFRTLPQEWMPV